MNHNHQTHAVGYELNVTIDRFKCASTFMMVMIYTLIFAILELWLIQLWIDCLYFYGPDWKEGI